MKTYVAVVGLIAVVVVGCAIDKVALTRFEPFANGFRYEALTTGMMYRLDDHGEKWRRKWLEQYVRDNEVCKGDYQVTNRKVVAIPGPVDRYRVIYYGVCN